jgi:hypothetical protein
MSDEKMTVESAKSAIEALLHRCRNGSFYEEYDESMQALKSACRWLETLTAALAESERQNRCLRSGIICNGGEIVEAAEDVITGELSGPWVRNIRAEKAESALADLKAENERLTRAVQGRDDEIEIYKALVQKVKAERDDLQALLEEIVVGDAAREGVSREE